MGLCRGVTARTGFGVLCFGLVLAACSTSRQTMAPLPPETDITSSPASEDPGPAGSVEADSPAALSGWSSEDHLAAFQAYLLGCGVSRDTDGSALCERARLLARTSRPVTSYAARRFFETGFRVVPVNPADDRPGLLTSYFAPEYPARRDRSEDFDTPVLARPRDLERTPAGVVQRRPDGSTGPYADRAAIEAAAAAGSPSAPVLAWMKAEDLFFLQIQGSGYLTFEDGQTGRAAYAADNGRPFVGIARPMVAQGLLPDNGTSGDAIRAWLASHRGREARAVTALNPRYIFFDLQPDNPDQASSEHPAGAAGVPLTPRRSVAVDPAHWAYGDLFWIRADIGGQDDGPTLVGATGDYRGLVMALDTGSAIRGPVRADFYMGRGEAAGSEAGSVRHPLRMWRLVPRP